MADSLQASRTWLAHAHDFQATLEALLHLAEAERRKEQEAAMAHSLRTLEGFGASDFGPFGGGNP